MFIGSKAFQKVIAQELRLAGCELAGEVALPRLAGLLVRASEESGRLEELDSLRRKSAKVSVELKQFETKVREWRKELAGLDAHDEALKKLAESLNETENIIGWCRSLHYSDRTSKQGGRPTQISVSYLLAAAIGLLIEHLPDSMANDDLTRASKMLEKIIGALIRSSSRQPLYLAPVTARRLADIFGEIRGLRATPEAKRESQTRFGNHIRIGGHGLGFHGAFTEAEVNLIDALIFPSKYKTRRRANG